MRDLRVENDLDEDTCAICADEREINARPWLYRIARNRCLNHLRAPRHAGQDSMDIFERDGAWPDAFLARHATIDHRDHA